MDGLDEMPDYIVKDIRSPPICCAVTVLRLDTAVALIMLCSSWPTTFCKRTVMIPACHVLIESHNQMFSHLPYDLEQYHGSLESGFGRLLPGLRSFKSSTSPLRGGFV